MSFSSDEDDLAAPPVCSYTRTTWSTRGAPKVREATHMRQQHRESERVRHKSMNKVIRHLSHRVPGYSAQMKETKIQSLRKVISYTNFLERFVTSSLTSLGYDTSTMADLFTKARSKRDKCRMKENAQRSYKRSRPTTEPGQPSTSRRSEPSPPPAPRKPAYQFRPNPPTINPPTPNPPKHAHRANPLKPAHRAGQTWRSADPSWGHSSSQESGISSLGAGFSQSSDTAIPPKSRPLKDARSLLKPMSTGLTIPGQSQGQGQGQGSHHRSSFSPLRPINMNVLTASNVFAKSKNDGESGIDASSPMTAELPFLSQASIEIESPEFSASYNQFSSPGSSSQMVVSQGGLNDDFETDEAAYDLANHGIAANEPSYAVFRQSSSAGCPQNTLTQNQCHRANCKRRSCEGLQKPGVSGQNSESAIRFDFRQPVDTTPVGRGWNQGQGQGHGHHVLADDNESDTDLVSSSDEENLFGDFRDEEDTPKVIVVQEENDYGFTGDW